MCQTLGTRYAVESKVLCSHGAFFGDGDGIQYSEGTSRYQTIVMGFLTGVVPEGSSREVIVMNRKVLARWSSIYKHPKAGKNLAC